MATRAAGDSTKAAGDATKAAGEPTKAAGESTKPAGGATRAARGATKAAGELFLRVFQEQPIFLRAAVILVLLGVTIILAYALTVAAFRGQSLRAGIVTLDQYVPPDVKKCESLTAQIPALGSFNNDQLLLLNGEMKLLYADNDKARSNYDNAIARNLSSSIAIKYSDDMEKNRKRLDGIAQEQNRIITERESRITEIMKACK